MLLNARAEVLIVDDHPLYRDGVHSVLARHAPGLRCRAVPDAAGALRLLALPPPVDLLLVDHRLPGTMDGLQLLAEVGALQPTAARILISGTGDPRLTRLARAMGLMGYLPKSMDTAAWLAALSQVLAGEPWFPADETDGAALTPRQAHILQRVAGGQTNKLIARELGVTERTVKYHLAEIFGRLGAASRAEAVARASARGWIAPPAARD